jgi:hypothetical protein
MNQIPRYLRALMFWATCSPCLYSIMARFGSAGFSSSSSCVSRRSHFRATRTILTPGQFSSISCFHFVSTFSSDCGESTLKQSIIAWVLSYDRDRSLSNSSWPAVSHKLNSTYFPSTYTSERNERLARQGVIGRGPGLKTYRGHNFLTSYTLACNETRKDRVDMAYQIL